MRRVLQPVKASNIDSPDMIFAAPRENICKARDAPSPPEKGSPFLMFENPNFSSICPLDRMLRDRSTFPSFAKQEEDFFLIQCSFNGKYLMPGSLHRCPESRFLKRLVRKNPSFPFAWEETTFCTARFFRSSHLWGLRTCCRSFHQFPEWFLSSCIPSDRLLCLCGLFAL